ncbi:hypothetical protein [Cohnella algarum]|uniref:hypothetical protein n=1 Tax=Cohnella algarum TaxID=2044859 RepID=UPI001967F869|nr:hypothetical protein [Cohnella algarum]MBN2980648.1 hypothetical protein [Cohnella algarum]
MIWIGSILGALILIVGIGGYFAINYAADKVLNSLVEPVGEPLDSSSSQTDSASPDAESSASPSSDPDSSPASSEAPASPSSTPKGSEQPASPSDGTDTGKSRQADQASGDNKGTSEGSAPPASPPSASPSPSPTSTYNPEISVDKAEEVQENISFSEKTKVMTIMLSKLSTSDIKTLQQLASGGLTVEKKKEAKALILEKLSEDEYNELIAIAQKYGLSQGKSYEDSLKEDLGN